MFDYVIIGGGIAGSTLAYRLLKQGAKVLVIDEADKNISSVIAAGIVNPITGKRTALTWKAVELFNELHKFYPTLEKELACPFFSTQSIFKIFDSIYEQNEWLNKQSESGYNQFIGKEVRFLNTEMISNPYGAMQIIGSGRLDIKLYLTVLHQWLKSQNLILTQHFDATKLEVKPDIIKYEKIITRELIFCEGPFLERNPFFNFLPHKSVHGEILEVEIENFYTDRIINKGIYILPLINNKFLVGATYNWDLKEAVTTSKGLEFLINKLKETIQSDFKVTAHYSGIRPSSNDRRPFLGRHPKYHNLSIFGGFGSKGVSLIPHLSKVFLNFLLHEVPLPRETDIFRVKESYI